MEYLTGVFIGCLMVVLYLAYRYYWTLRQYFRYAEAIAHYNAFLEDKDMIYARIPFSVIETYEVIFPRFFNWNADQFIPNPEIREAIGPYLV